MYTQQSYLQINWVFPQKTLCFLIRIKALKEREYNLIIKRKLKIIPLRILLPEINDNKQHAYTNTDRVFTGFIIKWWRRGLRIKEVGIWQDCGRGLEFEPLVAVQKNADFYIKRVFLFGRGDRIIRMMMEVWIFSWKLVLRLKNHCHGHCGHG